MVLILAQMAGLLALAIYVFVLCNLGKVRARVEKIRAREKAIREKAVRVQKRVRSAFEPRIEKFILEKARTVKTVRHTARGAFMATGEVETEVQLPERYVIISGAGDFLPTCAAQLRFLCPRLFGKFGLSAQGQPQVAKVQGQPTPALKPGQPLPQGVGTPKMTKAEVEARKAALKAKFRAAGKR